VVTTTHIIKAIFSVSHLPQALQRKSNAKIEYHITDTFNKQYIQESMPPRIVRQLRKIAEQEEPPQQKESLQVVQLVALKQIEKELKNLVESEMETGKFNKAQALRTLTLMSEYYRRWIEPNLMKRLL
jgi:hypothetical protein